MPRLSLSLLGPFQACLDDAQVTNFGTDKVRALLAYLAMEAGIPHRRETLADLLWPDRPQKAARRNLRQALSRLGRAMISVRDSDLAATAIGIRPARAKVSAFKTGDRYAEYQLIQKFAPAIRRILSNTEGPFAEIFERFLGGGAASAAPQSQEGK